MMNRQEALTCLAALGQPLEIVDVEVYGRLCRNYKHAPQNLRDLYQQNLSDKTFIVFEQQRFSFLNTWKAASAIGAGLVKDYNIRKGDRVAICMRNYPEWIVAFQAITSVGAIVVAINSMWQANEIQYGLQDSDCSLFIADQEQCEQLSNASIEISCPTLIVRGNEGSTLPRWEKLQQRHAGAGMPEVEIAAIDDVIIFYTSGSTGRPKGVVSSNLAVISALLSWEISLSAWYLTRNSSLVRGVQKPAALVTVPLFHVSGCHAVFLAALRSQTKLVLMRKWDPAKAVMVIEQEKITSFIAPSAITTDLTHYAQQQGSQLPTLAVVGGGGAARAPKQVRAIATAFATAMPSTGWGMTETNSMGTGIIGDNYLERPSSAGQATGPRDVIDIRIANAQGKSLPTGEHGEVQIRGTSMFRGYWNNPKATADAHINGWFKTGDVGYLDKEDYLFIVDRIKDMIIRGGENIGCGEVEAVLLEHPNIREAAVYAVPDERLGENVATTIYCTADIDETELRTFLEVRLASFKVPKYILKSAHSLPRTASGKIFKLQISQNAIASLRLSTINQPFNNR